MKFNSVLTQYKFTATLEENTASMSVSDSDIVQRVQQLLEVYVSHFLFCCGVLHVPTSALPSSVLFTMPNIGQTQFVPYLPVLQANNMWTGRPVKISNKLTASDIKAYIHDLVSVSSSYGILDYASVMQHLFMQAVMAYLFICPDLLTHQSFMLCDTTGKVISVADEVRNPTACSAPLFGVGLASKLPEIVCTGGSMGDWSKFSNSARSLISTYLMCLPTNMAQGFQPGDIFMLSQEEAKTLLEDILINSGIQYSTKTANVFVKIIQLLTKRYKTLQSIVVSIQKQKLLLNSSYGV